jgi:hypothetical protein
MREILLDPMEGIPGEAGQGAMIVTLRPYGILLTLPHRRLCRNEESCVIRETCPRRQ